MSEITIKDLEKTRTAAHINSNAIFPSLFQLLGQRQVYASQILSTSPEDSKILIEAYDFIEDQIKELLALK